MSALDEAIAIALSASGEVVDWSREPLTERERRIRARYIEHATSTWAGKVQLILLVLAVQGRGRVASDLHRVARQMAENAKRSNAQAERHRINRAIEDLDDGGAAS